MSTTVTYTEQTRLREAAERVVTAAREGLDVAPAIDLLSDVLRALDAEVCRACLHPTATGSVHAACVREREMIVTFLRRNQAYALANRVAADHHILTVPGQARRLSASTPRTPNY